MEQLISTLGYPIATGIVCFGYIYKMQQQQREDTNKREERMYEQMISITNTLNNINLSMQNINHCMENLNERIEKLEGSKYE